MALDISINDLITIRHEYRLGSDVSYNVLHYQLKVATVLATGLPLATTTPAEVLLPVMANAAFAQWAAFWVNGISNEVAYTSVTAQKVAFGPRSIPYTYIPAAEVLGEVDSESLPMQDAVTLLKKTGYGQRWGMGRLFISGIPESQTKNGVINDALAAVYNSWGNLIDDQFSCTADGVQYFFDLTLFSLPEDEPARIHKVTSVTLSNKIVKSQKRRRPGKGI